MKFQRLSIVRFCTPEVVPPVEAARAHGLQDLRQSWML
jgi:hypothetical protein